MYLRRFLMLALAVGGVRAAVATELAVQRFDSAHGLSGHPVTALVQDRSHRIWAGTWGGGAYVGDGRGWSRLTTRDGLLSDRVVAIIPGAAGEMWISSAVAPGGRSGLAVVNDGTVVSTLPGDEWEVSLGLVSATNDVWLAFRDGGVGRFRAGLLEPVAELDGVHVRAIVEDGDEGIWFMGRRGEDATAPGSLHRVAPGGVSAIRSGLPRAAFNAVLVGPDGTVWLGTESGLFHRRGGNFAPAEAGGARLDRAIRALSSDASGALWVGLDGAVVRVTDGQAQELRLPTAIGPVPVLDLMGGASGGVFVRTPQHLLRLEGRAADLVELTSGAPPPGTTPDGALATIVRLEEILDQGRTVIVDHEGSAWAIAGDAIVRYRGDESRRFGRGEGLSSEDVRTLFIDSAGRIWAGTARGLAVFEHELGRFRRISGLQAPVRAVHQDRAGTIYAATDAGVARVEQDVLIPWEPAAELGRVDAFAVDAAGALWVGGERGLAVSSIDGMIPHGAEVGLGNSAVTALLAQDSVLWVGFEDGLARRVGDRFEYMSSLSGQSVRQLIDRGDQGVWVVTAAGLRTSAEGVPVGPAVGAGAVHSAAVAGDTLWLSLEGGLLKERADLESLLDGITTSPARTIVVDSSDRLWLATADGVIRHAPARGGAPVKVRGLVGGIKALAAMELTERSGPLWLELSAVSWLGPRGASDVRFEARLKPRDTDWGVARVDRLRPLGSLPPGNYIYEVRSVNRELEYGPVTQVPIVVRSGREDPSRRPSTPESTEPRRLKLPPMARP